MNATKWLMVALVIGLGFGAREASARSLSVEVWTDRGKDAVYQPGDKLQIKARPSEDAYLLVYEIDAEGYVHVLFPQERDNGLIEARTTFEIPAEGSSEELVVQGPVGEGYVVAVASRDPFQNLPWYLRAYNAQAEELGYAGGPQHGEGDDEAGVTAEGRIVGDPFVAMERIRRSVVDQPADENSFATAYSTYYVHNEVRYPRYLCYDCHRPNRWTWWDGFDPYYARCSVFDFRVNWSWGWGPAYWSGYVPYYMYVYRHDCPPRFQPFLARGDTYSGWDGWRRWRSLWGSNLARYKSAPPAGYRPPTKFDDPRGSRGRASIPPGFMIGGSRSVRAVGVQTVAAQRGQELGVNRRDIPGARAGSRWGDRGGLVRTPREPGLTADRPWRRISPPDPGGREVRPWRGADRRERVSSPPIDRPRQAEPTPGGGNPRREVRPEPRSDLPRSERGQRDETPRRESPPPSTQERPREERGGNARPNERPPSDPGSRPQRGHGH